MTNKRNNKTFVPIYFINGTEVFYIEDGGMDQEDRRSGMGTVAVSSAVGNGNLFNGPFEVPAP